MVRLLVPEEWHSGAEARPEPPHPPPVAPSDYWDYWAGVLPGVCDYEGNGLAADGCDCTGCTCHRPPTGMPVSQGAGGIGGHR